jgi:hypothetical protein
VLSIRYLWKSQGFDSRTLQYSPAREARLLVKLPAIKISSLPMPFCWLMSHVFSITTEAVPLPCGDALIEPVRDYHSWKH